MTRRTPLFGQISRPGDGRKVSFPDLGDLMLHKVQRHILRQQIGVRGQRLTGRRLGIEAVHQDKRQANVMLAAQIEQLMNNNIQKGKFPFDLHQRFRPIHAHGRA